RMKGHGAKQVACGAPVPVGEFRRQEGPRGEVQRSLFPSHHGMMPRRREVVLGSTGSIGTNSLDVIERLAERLEVIGLSAHANLDLVLRQANRHQPRYLTITDPASYHKIDAASLPAETQVLHGEDGIARMVSDPD